MLIRKIYRNLPSKYKEVAKKYYEYFNKSINDFIFLLKFAFLIFIIVFRRKINSINFFERKIYSQNGEDGIIKMIFTKIGTLNKFCVEFGVGDAKENNTRYLIKKGHWHYLHMDTEVYPLAYSEIKREFITTENVNSLFRKYNVPKEFDLLSIDIDYNTYWVWKAIKGYSPRLVVIEYNASLPLSESKTVKYDPNAIWDGTNYFGASLLALVNLGKSKGYTLIGCDNKGVNAFFIRDDLVANHFVIKNIQELWKPPQYGEKINGKYIGKKSSDKPFIS